MSFYNTGNPVPSIDPRDLDDNAKHLDDAIHSAADTWVDRLGATRKSIKGVENGLAVMQAGFDASQAARAVTFAATQADKQNQFLAFLAASGYETPVDYAPGISITRSTQIVRYLSELYRPKVTSLPFTTTTFPADTAKWIANGDNSLRQDMASFTDASKGANLVGRKRSKLSSQIDTVQKTLDGQALSAWEFAASAGGYVAGGNPSTWEWAPAINAALLYAFNNGYSAVTLVDGTYTITQAGINLQPGVDLIGSGKATIIKLVGTAGGNAEITSLGDFDFSIRNLSVTHTSLAQSNAPLAIRAGTHDITIDNCWITTDGQAMTIGSSSDVVTPKNITVSNCYIDCMRGPRGRTGTDGAVDDRNIRFVNNTVIQRNTSGEIGIEMWISGVTYDNNVVINPTNQGGASALVGSSNNFKAINNSCYGFQIGIEWGLFGSSPVGCKIGNNYVRGCVIGISVSSVSNSPDTLIHDNTIVFDDAIRTDYDKGISFKSPYTILDNNTIIHSNGENYALDITDVNSRKYRAYHGDQNTKDIKIFGGVVLNINTGIQVSATSGYNEFIGVSFVNVNSASVQSGGTPEERFIGCSFRNHGAAFNNRFMSFSGCTFVNDATFFAYNKGFVQSTNTINNTVVVIRDCSFSGVLTEAFQSDSAYPFTGSGAGRPKIQVKDGIHKVTNVSLWTDVKAVYTTAGVTLPYNTTIETWSTNKTFIKRYAVAGAVISDGTDRIENY